MEEALQGIKYTTYSFLI